jgi:hypothetical protein
MRNVSDKSCRENENKFLCPVKGKGTVRPKTGHEGPEVE